MYPIFEQIDADHERFCFVSETTKHWRFDLMKNEAKCECEYCSKSTRIVFKYDKETNEINETSEGIGDYPDGIHASASGEKRIPYTIPIDKSNECLHSLLSFSTELHRYSKELSTAINVHEVDLQPPYDYPSYYPEAMSSRSSHASSTPAGQRNSRFVTPVARTRSSYVLAHSSQHAIFGHIKTVTKFNRNSFVEIEILELLQESPWIVQLWQWEIVDAKYILVEEDLVDLVIPDPENANKFFDYVIKFTLDGLHALQMLKACLIIHRDIKNGNFLYSPRKGNWQLFDFDSACFCDEYVVNEEKIGTDGYIAPEILSGHPYSFPVDMFSFGTTIYHKFDRWMCMAYPNYSAHTRTDAELHRNFWLQMKHAELQQRPDPDIGVQNYVKLRSRHLKLFQDVRNDAVERFDIHNYVQ